MYVALPLKAPSRGMEPPTIVHVGHEGSSTAERDLGGGTSYDANGLNVEV